MRISPRIAKLILTLAAMLAMATSPCPAMARDDLLEDSQAFLAKVAADEKSGVLSLGQAMLIRFQFIFEPGVLPVDYRVQGFSPLKCATDLVRRFQQVRDELDPETRRLIESYLERPPSRLSHLSTEGHFLLTYQLSGEDAVPTADLDPANGIPDYVEEVARYLEQSWTVQVVMTGFADPLAGTAPCPVSFRAMQNYGYSYIINQNLGTTGLVLHNDFQGFPPNDDPDGPALGAAKVTAAHEFKHASQYRGSRWSEEGWIELDAVWAEELVFDQTNDYYNYLLGGSPIRHPDLPLDGGSSGTGSYEDCVFQIWMQETWGIQPLVEFWQRRMEHPAEPVMQTYQAILQEQGAEPAQAWGKFTAWNYATDNRAVPGLGYGEAANYPLGMLEASLDAFPVEMAGEIEHLAANFVRLAGWNESQVGTLRVEFTCEPGDAPMTVTFVIRRQDGSGVMETMDTQDAGLAQHTLSVPLQDIQSAGIVIGNPDTGGPARGFQLQVTRDIQPAQLQLVTTQLQGEVASGSSTQLEAVIGNAGPAGTVLNYQASVWAEDSQPLLVACSWPVGQIESGSVASLLLDCDATGVVPGEYLNWLLVQHDGAGLPGIVPLTVRVLPGASPASDGPPATALAGNHPNPFNPRTEILFQLGETGPVTLEILDVRGRRVCNLLAETRAAGAHRVTWNGRDDQDRPLPAGVYLVRLSAPGFQGTSKLLLAK